MTATATGHVLVVDDQEANRLLLRDLLEAHGHRVSEAASGEAALRVVAADVPDVVLLDVNMQGMDGLDVCRRLKGDAATAAIPILLQTALSQRADRLRGIEAGANDYVTKPFDTTELALRVRNALNLRRLHTQVAEQYRRLKELEDLRDSLVHMLVHDLRAPLTGLNLTLEILEQDIGAVDGSGQLAELLTEARSAATSMAEMVSDVLDISRFEEGAMPLHRAATDLGTLAREAVALVAGRGRKRAVEIVAPERLTAHCDAGIIRRVIANLVANAVNYSPAGSPVRVDIENDGTQVRLRVSDQGPGIPEAYHEKIFEKFGQVEAVRQRVIHSSGLGLTFCKLGVETHGGSIGVESDGKSGSTFWFVLPA